MTDITSRSSIDPEMDDRSAGRQQRELELVRAVLENDLNMAQRGDSVAAVGRDAVLMMDFDEIWASDGFEDIAILASERWYRTFGEMAAEIEKFLDEREGSR